MSGAARPHGLAGRRERFDQRFFLEAFEAFTAGLAAAFGDLRAAAFGSTAALKAEPAVNFGSLAAAI